jgi:hypothetical protein
MQTKSLPQSLSCLWLSGYLLIGGAESLAASNPSESEPQQVTPASAHQHHRGPKQIALPDAEQARITFWKPDLTSVSLQAAQGQITLPNTGMGNYHALVVEKDRGERVETLIHYAYLRGKPSQRSPAALAGLQKTRFEIVPDPIPREHYHYFSNQTWGFLLRLDGQPVPNTEVVLQTDHGSRVTGSTDQAGRVSLQLPDDFPGIRPGQRDKRSAEFRVNAQIPLDDKTYHTTLSADYRVNPAHWQSFSWGVAMAGLGFLAGGMLGRVGKGNHKEKR